MDHPHAPEINSPMGNVVPNEDVSLGVKSPTREKIEIGKAVEGARVQRMHLEGTY